MKLPSYSPHIKHWALDQEIVFLNHGSFGATPKVILEKQNQLRMCMESEPVRFSIRELYPLYQASIEKLGSFIGANSSNLVFMKNATMGVNTILHSLNLNEGDEVLMHSHAYGACANTIRWYAQKNKWKVNVAEIPYPIKNPDEVVEAFVKAITPKTKFAMIDHITSATGIIFPVEKIVKELQAKGIEVLVDGAHAPAHVELNLEKLGAEYFVGNCHKWICSPKGSALLYVRPDKQKSISPLQFSHYFDAPVAADKNWQGQFFWPGTDDYTAYCCVGDAIDFFENNFEGGWKEIRKQNRDLCLKARKMLAEKMQTELPAPEEMIGNLSNILLRDTELPPYGFNYISPLQEQLFTHYKIEVPVFTFNREQPRQWARIAVQLYNSFEQYEYLGDALKEILKR
ncbi:MAG: aminotransferase class V-fold PLP-dependent enzyme [Bacteroidia bacterium]|nr:aminotransferase class V-fold PLP-dependent enzyme [Bacteroidia bacterium]